MSRILGVAVLAPLMAMVVLGGCRPVSPAEKGAQVIASFYPLYEAAQKVAGDKFAVRNLVPAGTEPHDFEPSARDTAALLDARMVVYIGAGFEPWLDRLSPQMQKKGIVLIEVTRNFDLAQMEDEDDPSDKVPDPHVWLDPVLMQQIVTAVKDAYVRMDPANQSVYESNAAAYSARLEALHQKFQQELQGYQKRAFITSHAAFSYLAKRYDLEQVPIAGVSPEQEPSPRELAEVANLARDRGIKYIFFETLVSPKLAQTIAREVGAGTLVLNPLEGLTDEELRAGKDYISVMEENLANLKKALEASQ